MAAKTRAHTLVIAIRLDGKEDWRQRFTRGDLAQRYAQEIAESLARTWVANCAAGRPGGEVRDIVVIHSATGEQLGHWNVPDIADTARLAMRHRIIRRARTAVVR